MAHGMRFRSRRFAGVSVSHAKCLKTNLLTQCDLHLQRKSSNSRALAYCWWLPMFELTLYAYNVIAQDSAKIEHQTLAIAWLPEIS